MRIITTTKRTLIIFIAIALINSGCKDEGIKSEKRSGIKYFVIIDGNDNSIGSFKSTWRTIEKINRTEINPGDAAYFEGGSKFVFVYKKSLLSERVKVKDELFQRNLYWNLEGNKSFENYSSFKEWAEATGKEMMGDSLTGLYQDPGFVNPGALSVTDPEKINSENLSPYKPKSGSALINNGLNLIELFGLNPGSKDILGAAIPIEAKFDIGAIEYNDQ